MTGAGSSHHCCYCGLPVRASPADGAGDLYCCFGCRFAASVAGAGEKGQAAWALTRLGLAVFFTMNVMVFTMTLWSQDVFPAGDDPVSRSFHSLFRGLSLLATLPVLFLLGVPLLENAIDCLRRGRPSTDFLLVAGVVAAYLYSAHSVYAGRGPVYFEVACVILLLVTLGRWLEASARVSATEAIDAMHRLLPDTIRRRTAGGEEVVPLAEVRPGDCVRVLAGERVPVDGAVAGAGSVVDEQILTGESTHVVKHPGDPVYGGTLNLDADLLIQATSPAGGGVLARILEVMDRARRTRSRFERLADRLSSWLLLPVAVTALAAFAYHARAGGLEAGILAGLAVTLIACPCALGIATPLAVWAALGRAAGEQILLRSGETLERLARVRTVFLDKTGTLTTGTPTVSALTADSADRDEVLRQSLALASASTHGLSRAVAEYASESLKENEQRPRELQTVAPDGPADPPGPESRVPSPEHRTPNTEPRTRTHPGRGLSAPRPSGESAHLGSPAWLDELGLRWPDALRAAADAALARGRPLTCLGWGGSVRGVFEFDEQLRPEAAAAVAGLRRLGLRVEVLTGDHAGRGRAVGALLGVPVHAGLLPDAKLALVQSARGGPGLVAMVGDGVNDAPALAGSDVGIAMGCGADVTRDSASVCLLGNDLAKLPLLVALARRATRVIRQNLFWACVYNAAGVALACTGRLNPVLAAAAMTASSLLVVANSVRLRGPAGAADAAGVGRTAAGVAGP